MTQRSLIDVKKKIQALTEAELKSGKPYLLSKLGNDLGQDLRILKDSRTTLAEFIQSEFAGQFELVLGGAHRNIRSIVRAGDAVLPEIESVDDGQNKPMRFHYRFWAAFSVPLPEGIRYLDLDDFSFEDNNRPDSENLAEITPEFVAPEKIEKRDIAIISNIKRWATEHGYSLNQFSAKSSTAGSVAPTGRSLLHSVLGALDKKQLASLSLSGDIIAALLKRPA